MKNPKKKFSKPGKSEKPQSFPGLEEAMITKPVFNSESYIGTNKLKDKKAVITGGDSGIGRAVAIAFAKECADVIIQYLAEEKTDAEKTITEIENIGRRAIGFTGDFRKLNNCKKLIDLAKKEFGRIDVLVNNAAIQRNFETIEEITPTDFEEIYRVNVVAPFEIIKYAEALMPEGASIINTVSIQAYDPSFILLP